MSLRQCLLSPLLKLFFRLLYHPFAWTYDLVAAVVSIGRWREWVLAALPYLDGPRILEVGHGPGHLQAALWAHGLRPLGLDASRQMGRLAFRRIQNLGFFPLLVNGYAQFMPFKSASFHQLVATFPSDYIAQPATLVEAFRILVPGGRFVILPAAWITGPSLRDRLAAWLFRFTYQAPEPGDNRMEVYLKIPLEEAGFRVETRLLQARGSAVLLFLATRPAP